MNESISGDNEAIDSELNKNSFFKSQFSIIKENDLKFHYIDLDDVTTYKCFLKSLKESCKNKKTSLNDLSKNFKFVQMSEITIPYIQIKNSLKTTEEKINDRYLMYKSNESNDSFLISSKIRDELAKIISPYDLEIVQNCNKILSKIGVKDDPNRFTIMNELEISSHANIIMIFSKLYDFQVNDVKKMGIIKNSHYVFLKKEYFSIIKYLYNSNNFDDHYENNLDILNDQYKNDLNIIASVIDNIRKGLILVDEKIDDSLKGTTNYEIRQKEKTRQQIVQIGIDGDLRDEVPQDF